MAIPKNIWIVRVPMDSYKTGAGGEVGLAILIHAGRTPTGVWYMSISIPGTGFYWIKYFKRSISPSTEGAPASDCRETRIEWRNEN